MKRFLPTMIRFFIAVLTIQFVFSSFGSFFFQASAQTATPTITPSFTPTPTTPSSIQQNPASPADLPSDWIIDPEVTSIGKNAARAGLVLDWAIQNYDWSYVQPGRSNPLIPFWITLRNIVYSLLILVVIVGAFVLIITRGRSVTLRKFIPRFLGIVILVTFSFAFVELLFQVVDVFQGFFIRPGGVPISQKDLLYVGWQYQPFVGLRAVGEQNVESATISLILVKMTSFTYYAMVTILLIRKIILWFFIMISPFFPLLLFFYPLRNTAKIWLGEFFRWLLYAPLFAIFLAGLVSLWKAGIPLLFNFNDAGKGVIFPTAVSILLGGPLQKVGVANTVNLPDTFGLYMVALLMLWMVILFPFVLLQIFLDYLSNVNVNQNAFAKQLMNFISRPPAPSGGTPPPSPISTGVARALPFLRDFAIPRAPTTTGLAKEIPRVTQIQTQKQQQTLIARPLSLAQKEVVEKTTNIAIPTMRDIARFDATRVRTDTEKQKEIERIKESLRNIATPQTVQVLTDRQRYSEIREKLTQESLKGNQLATNMLKAAQSIANQTVSTVQNITNIQNVMNNLANPVQVQSTKEREKYVEIRERLIKETEKEKESSVATTLLSSLTKLSATTSSEEATKVLSSMREAVATQKESVLSTTLLSQIEKYSSATSTQEKTQLLEAMRETLTKESKQTSTTLATTMLSMIDSVIQSSRASLQSLAQAVANPQQIPERVKESVTDLKETLKKESEKGNTLAQTVLSMLEKLENVERTSVSLSNILHPERVEKTTERERFEKIRETLLKEEKTQNTFAAYLTSGIEKLSSATSTEEKSEILQTIKEQVLNEKQRNNPLAADIASLLPGLLSLESTKEVGQVQSELEKARDTGNPLATKLLAIAKETSAERQKQQLASLQTEIAAEKEKGNPLATILADMLVPKTAETGISASLPATNRIQEVSLDDYEAVKKMWTENYQSKDVQSANDLSGKKQMIQSDIDEITKTIDLLTSQDEEKIEEGMQKVSDILPFLLIGGFSTSEIVAYLKAKQEAGKEVLSQIEKQTTEEDTTLSVTQKAATTQTMKNQTVQSTAVPLPTVSLEEPEQPEVVATVAPKLRVSKGQANEQMLRLANISIPSIRTVASFDEALLSHDTKRSQEVQKIQDTLKMIGNPSTVGDTTEKARYADIHKALITEGEKGNDVASAIVSAGSIVDRLSVEESFAGALRLSSILTKLKNPAALTDKRERELFEKLSETMHFLSGNGDSFAKVVLETLEKGAIQSVSTGLTLHNKLLAASSDGNQLATSLLAQVQKIPESEIKKSRDGLVGLYLLTSAQSGKKTSLSQSILSLQNEVQKKAEEGNTLAKEIVGLKATQDLTNIASFMESLVKSQDPFAASLQTSLPALATSFAQPEKENTRERLSHLFSILSRPFSTKEQAEIVTLRNELEVARNEGNNLAALVLQKADETTRHEIRSLSQILSYIDNPSTLAVVSDQEGYKNIRNRLEKEEASGNTLAHEILSVSHALSTKNLTRVDKVSLSVMAWEKLMASQENGDRLANEIIRIAENQATKETFFLHIYDAIRHLANPERIKDEDTRNAFLSLRKVIETEKEKGDPLASLLSDAIKDPGKQTDGKVFEAFEENLNKEEEKGSAVAKAFLGVLRDDSETMFAIMQFLRNISDPEKIPLVQEKEIYLKVRKKLEEEAKKDSAVAMSLLTAAERSKTQGDDLSEARKIKDLLEHDESDTAKWVRTFIEKEAVQFGETLILRSILHDMINPSFLTDEKERAMYETLAKDIALESQHANPIAKTIEKTTRDISGQNISVDQENQTVFSLYSLLKRERENGNVRASDMMELVKAQSLRMRAGKLVEVLSAVSDPSSISPGPEQVTFQKLSQELMTAKNHGDQTAILLLSLSQGFATKQLGEGDLAAIVSILLEKLTEEKEKVNTFAQSIFALMKPSTLAENIEAIEKELSKAEKNKDPAAARLLAIIQKNERSGRGGDSLVLPTENRIQEVSLDDYEAVRSMWTESFRQLPVPMSLTGEKITRNDWLAEEIEAIQETIDLLLSQDVAKRNEGMLHVANILPFLMIGGFSLSEIVSYLKAKMEAAKTVAESMDDGGEKVFLTNQKDDKASKSATAEEMMTRD
ncbi:MAG: hypothetical protein Q8Q49_01470 [bacterium]|nr:hypothetical protein [bacterium]